MPNEFKMRSLIRSKDTDKLPKFRHLISLPKSPSKVTQDHRKWHRCTEVRDFPL